MTRHGLQLLTLAVLGLALAAGLAAQEEPMLIPVEGPFFANVDLRDLPPATPWQPGDPIIIIPEGYLEEEREIESEAYRTEGFDAGTLWEPRVPQGADPFEVNIAGLGFSGVVPPDTIGDVGPNHYIQMTNRSGGSNVLVLDKAGNTLVEAFDLDSLWVGGGPCDNGLGDPIVIHDDVADRWVLAEFASAGSHFCIYVSQTADPVDGGWFLYDFTTPNFPDYPKYGAWPDAYYVTTYEPPNLGVYALDRTDMLAGLPAGSAIRLTVPALTAAPRDTRVLPAHNDGGTPAGGEPNYIFRTVEQAQDPGNPTDRIEIREYHVDFAVPGNSTLTLTDTIALADFAIPDCENPVPPRSCVPQPGTTNELDALWGRPLMQLQWRDHGAHSTMVVSQPEGAGSEIETWGERWWELRKPNAEGAAWTIFQEGTYSPDTEHRWMGSAAMNGVGEIAVGYSVSSTTVFPSIRVAGRSASDAAGELTLGEFEAVAGTNNQTNTQRWGDYSAMTVDPADDLTFWYTQEYIVTQNQWSTRIMSFKVNGLFADNFESGDTGAWDVTQN